MALVYVARNKVNGKLYIGATRTSLERRAYMHIWSATSPKGIANALIFGKAIKKYGGDAFEFSVLEDGLSEREAADRERHYIATLRPAYNILLGKYAPNGAKWTPERHAYMAKALRAAWTEERRRKQIPLMRGRKWTAEQRRKTLATRAAMKLNFRPVVCLNDGRWFEGIKLAVAAYGVSCSRICSSCSGREVSANGLFFAHAAKPLTLEQCNTIMEERKARLGARVEKLRLSRSRPVVCITDGKAYPSGRAAAKHYKLAQMTVVQCCRNGATTVSGLRFRYADKPAYVRPVKSAEELAAIKERRMSGWVRTWAKQRKKVICIESGTVFDSIGDAARACGKTTSLVSAAIYRNGRCAGLHFRFLEDFLQEA